MVSQEESTCCLQSTIHIVSDESIIQQHPHISTALTFTSLDTIVFAMFLIRYKIHTVSENVGRSRKRYNHIVATIIELSAVYSLVLLSYAMTVFNPPFYTVASPFKEVGYYLEATLDTVLVCNIYASFGIHNTET